MGERIAVRFYPAETRKSHKSKRFTICLQTLFILFLLACIAAFVEISRENWICESPPMPTSKQLTHNMIKATPTKDTFPVKKIANHAAIHIVEAEQTLYSISRTYNVSIESIRQFNNLKNNTIKTGMRLKIPAIRHQQ